MSDGRYHVWKLLIYHYYENILCYTVTVFYVIQQMVRFLHPNQCEIVSDLYSQYLLCFPLVVESCAVCCVLVLSISLSLSNRNFVYCIETKIVLILQQPLS